MSLASENQNAYYAETIRDLSEKRNNLKSAIKAEKKKEKPNLEKISEWEKELKQLTYVKNSAKKDKNS